MVRARMRHDWIVAASHLSLLANCHRDAKRRAFTPVDFMPGWMVADTPRPKAPPATAEQCAMLERMLNKR